MEDHHVDRPDVEARQRAQLTGTNRSFDLIALVAKARFREQTTEIGGRITVFRSSRPKTSFASVEPWATQAPVTAIRPLTVRPPSSDTRSSPAWWPLQGDQTRSHPELGRQTP